jgi:2-dehydro-3-deoxygluconokinase
LLSACIRGFLFDVKHSQDVVDLLTVGESMLRFSVPTGQLLVDAPSFAVHVAGTESNVAVALVRMGFTARWLSQLTRNVLGRRITDAISGYGVDCSHVAWTDAGRVGVYYLEFGAAPRPTKVLYDRSPSSAQAMDEKTFDPLLLKKARILHLTGITVALSESCHRLVQTFIEQANELHVAVVFDVNYRALLWSHKECRQKLEPLLSKVDTIIVSRRDAGPIFDISGEPVYCAEKIQAKFGVPRVAITVGDQGAVGLENGVAITVPGYRVDIVDRIGAGDSFAAGVIGGLLEGNFARGLQYGVAMSALQLTTAGDLFRFSRAEVLDLMAAEGVIQLVR